MVTFSGARNVYHLGFSCSDIYLSGCLIVHHLVFVTSLHLQPLPGPDNLDRHGQFFIILNLVVKNIFLEDEIHVAQYNMFCQHDYYSVGTNHYHSRIAVWLTWGLGEPATFPSKSALPPWANRAFRKICSKTGGEAPSILTAILKYVMIITVYSL